MATRKASSASSTAGAVSKFSFSENAAIFCVNFTQPAPCRLSQFRSKLLGEWLDGTRAVARFDGRRYQEVNRVGDKGCVLTNKLRGDSRFVKFRRPPSWNNESNQSHRRWRRLTDPF